MASAKVKNLDIQNLYLLNPAAKFVLAALAIAGVLAVGYAAVFREQLETLSTQEEREAELKETYTKKSIEAASLDNLKAELASIRSSFDILLKQLPTDAEIPTLIQELHQAGSANGLRLDSVIPQVPVNDGPIQKLPYEISITGKYNQINQFARDVGGLSRIITLESLKVSNVSDGKNSKDIKNDTLILRAIATTYKARPADEVAAELATQQSQAQGNSENGQANSEQK
ncbi:pilus assembly protein, PilO [Neisseria sp. HMSC06F02]|nr:pilus assembly protein, PilO [Neisseria sp. HMSC06F02]